MRSPLNALRPFLVKEAQARREALAADAFKIDTVKAATLAAAMRGELSVKIALGEAVTAELRGTEAARALAAWAAEQGLSLEWAERLAERDGGLTASIGEPILAWGDERAK